MHTIVFIVIYRANFVQSEHTTFCNYHTFASMTTENYYFNHLEHTY